jgi:hypothetical protein
VHFAKTTSLVPGIESFARVLSIVTKVCYKWCWSSDCLLQCRQGWVESPGIPTPTFGIRWKFNCVHGNVTGTDAGGHLRISTGVESDF